MAEPLDVDNGSNAENTETWGCLTHTLIASPVLLWTAPARVRSPQCNDVVFVGPSWVRVEQVCNDFSFRFVAEKSDFAARIRCCRIFGLPREATAADLSQIIKSEPEIKLETDSTLPPHLLIVILENQTIEFLWTARDMQLCSTSMPLLSSLSRRERLGHHLAVDPRSRAFAVAAMETWVQLCSLKSRDALETQYAQTGAVSPVASERIIKVSGIIHKMEFLHTSSHDVVLLLLVVCEGKSQFVYFEWTATMDLASALLEPKLHPLPTSDPMLLIPSTRPYAVLVAFHDTVAMYQDLLAGNASCQTFSLSIISSPEPSAYSRSWPRWVQWARQRDRHGTETVVLCREDGLLQYVDLSPQIRIHEQAAQIGPGMDSAFSILDLGPLTGDVLLGNGSQGQISAWLYDPKKAEPAIEVCQVQQGWAPIHDMISAKSDGNSQQQFIACTPQGGVYELQQTVRLQPLVSPIELDETMTDAALDIFATWSGDVLLVLISHLDQSLLVCQRPDAEPELLESFEHLHLEERSLAFCRTINEDLVQITTRGIYGLGDLFTHQQTVLAAAAVPTAIAYILDTSPPRLHIGSIASRAICRSVDLPHPPTCLGICIFHETKFVFVGDADSRLLVYSEAQDSPTARYDLGVSSESIAIQVGAEIKIACGLRDGQVLVFSGHELNLVCQLNLGRTPVKIAAHPREPMQYLLLSNSVGRILDLERDYRIRRIPCNNDVLAVCHTDGPKTAFLHLVSGMLHISELDSHVLGAVARQWQVPAAPTQLRYSETLQKLLILGHQPEVSQPFQTRNSSEIRPGQRMLRPLLFLLDVHKSIGSCEEGHELPFEPGEKYLGVCEWLIMAHGRRYHMLLFHTMINLAAGQTCGRVLLCSVHSINGQTAPIRVKKVIETAAPVTAVGAGEDEENGPAFAYGSGNELVLLRVDHEQSGIRFLPPIRLTLRSTIRRITFLPLYPFLLVTTASESLQVFRYGQNWLEHIFGDSVARLGLCHHVSDLSLVLATDMTGGVVGLQLPDELRTDNSMKTQFQAHCVPAITRLESVREHQTLRNEIFVGTSTDGTLHQIQILPKAPFLLLDFLHNMLSTGLKRVNHNHVNGDALKCLLKGSDGISAQLNASCPVLHPEVETSAEKWHCFRNYAKAVLKNDQLDDRQLVEEVVSWLTCILRPVL